MCYTSSLIFSKKIYFLNYAEYTTHFSSYMYILSVIICTFICLSIHFQYSPPPKLGVIGVSGNLPQVSWGEGKMTLWKSPHFVTEPHMDDTFY